jgi:Fe-S cluster assembly ATP-binding protein
MLNTLEIKNLHVEIEDKKILKGLNLTIKSGEIHVIMGPNGSGKSTLCKVILGHPKYTVTEGTITFNGQDLSELDTTERANLGLFLAFQHPIEIPGITLGNFLRHSKNANQKAESSEAKPVAPVQFMKELKEELELLKMDPLFAARSVNEGFSGGEKKRAEIAQINMLNPKVALLDEIDSGLDIDALKTAADGINRYFTKNNPAILLVTHYQRILNYLKPHHVHVMSEGEIVMSGDSSLAEELEREGYQKYIK